MCMDVCAFGVRCDIQIECSRMTTKPIATNKPDIKPNTKETAVVLAFPSKVGEPIKDPPKAAAPIRREPPEVWMYFDGRDVVTY